jgi:uncharacterized protein (DUF362 family)
LILESSEFAFEPSPYIGRARQILIKPTASTSQGYPLTTSPQILEAVISTIREVSEADILLLEGSPDQESMEQVYRGLGYKFPRVHMLDVRDCVLVEVENPLPHPFAMSTFWLPNLVLYCDYLISISPCKIVAEQGDFTVSNLLGLLPVSKYRGESEYGWGALYSLGIHKVAADLYFTLPFDLGIIEATTKFICNDDSDQGEEESYGKVFVGEPYEVDKEASETMGLSTDYLGLIEGARSQVQF